MRRLAGGMALLFLAAAVLQWNDPDPWLWIALYAVAAGLSAAAWRGRRPLRTTRAALLVFAGLALLWLPALARAPAASLTRWEMRAPADEEAREALGLLLCALWTACLALTKAPAAGRSGGTPRP